MGKNLIEKFRPFSVLLFPSGFSGGNVSDKTEQFSENAINPNTFEKLDPEKITTKWNDSYFFNSKEEALKELESLKTGPGEINDKFRLKFENLSGSVLLNYLETEKLFAKSLEILYTYAATQHSKNVNDEFFASLLTQVQDLLTEYKKAKAFVTLKLTSLGREEWTKLFVEGSKLELYRPYFETAYLRFAEHRPENEAQARYIAELENERMKIETKALAQITNEVTMAGNITLENGGEFAVNSQSYSILLSTDKNRENRRRCYERRFYHLINNADVMASIYSKKAALDDLVAKELNYIDFYQATLYNFYLTPEKIDGMNTVFKAKKAIFEPYNKFRRKMLGLESLKPYDLILELSDEPGKNYPYVEALQEIQKSYVKMGPNFNEIFLKIVSGNFIDVYPDPEQGKQPGAYCTDFFALKTPALIFINYNGLLIDQKTLTHELGHAINFYLMSNSVDYLYCSGPTYEMEVASTFNEELLVDYILENADRKTAITVLSQHISDYENLFTRQPLITEFEYKAHKLCAEKAAKNETITGADLNALWTELSKEYRSESVEYYPENSAEWTYINHIYLIDNYYTFNYAVSQAIALALFKQYKADPVAFNKNYLSYLSVGSTITPGEKLKNYFGIEINSQLFETAMDTVQLRIQELRELGEEA
jgi:oligoendopeptidase F